MPQVVQWPQAPDAQRAVIATCEQSLLRGELVALPTESGYVLAAGALNPEAVARLADGRGREAAAVLAVLTAVFLLQARAAAAEPAADASAESS